MLDCFRINDFSINILHTFIEFATMQVIKPMKYFVAKSEDLHIVLQLLSTSVSRFYAASGGKPFVYMCTSPDGPETLVPECYIFQAVLVDNSTLSGDYFHKFNFFNNLNSPSGNGVISWE